MNYDQDLSGFDWIDDVQFSESDYSLVSEHDSTANRSVQSHVFGTTNNASPDVTTRPILHKLVVRQAAQIDTSSEIADLKGRYVSGVADDQAKLDRKRKNDRVYRQRLKESKRKTEVELEALRKENAALQKKLQKLELKPDGDHHQQNVSDQYYCKMEFRLDCYDDESRAEAMKIVGGITGMKRVCLDIEENKLTLHGKDIDTLLLQTKLKKICNARLLSLSMDPKIDREKEDGKIMVERDCMVVARNSALMAQSSAPMSYATSYPYPFAHVASAYPTGAQQTQGYFNLTKAAIFLFVLLIFVLCSASSVFYYRLIRSSTH